MTIHVLGIDNVMISVGDLHQARQFYEDRLGLPLKFLVDDYGIAGYRLGTEEPGLVLKVADIPPTSARVTPRLWLEVADARAVAQRLREQDIPLLHEPFEVATGWTVECADPWGNVLGFTDYIKDPAKGRSARGASESHT
jgi:catechol 2,3-dioxygenase-like lactoylglutathione lyase family enzyme